MNVAAFVLSGILPPIFVSALALGIAWRPFARSVPRDGPGAPELNRAALRKRAWAAPVGIGLGFAWAGIALHGWPKLAFDVELKQGLVFVAVVAAAAGLFEALRGRASLVLRALLSFALPYYLLDFVREHVWSARESLLWTALLGAAVFLVVLGTEGLARRSRGATLPALLLVIGVLQAGALHFSGSISLGQLAGAWTSALGVCLVVGLLRPEFQLRAGALATLVPILTGCLLGGRYASELSPLAFVLLWVAPLAPWVAELPLLRGRRTSLRFLVALVAVGLCAGTAFGLELAASLADPYVGY